MTRQRPHRGAALLTAMLTVTLVASLAASALWQQWRTVEVESAERARLQAAWLLVGALDWSRLILREDSLARNGDGTDNLTEPWAVPLEEARLSTFLAAQNNVSQSDQASVDNDNAFLSGSISDLQARLNVRNLVDGDKPDPQTVQQFARLFQQLQLPRQELDLLARQLQQALASNADASNSAAPLLPQRVEQLTWLGLAPKTVAALAPHISLLPVRSQVNLNTASAIVLWASAPGISLGDAQRLVQARAGQHFRRVADAQALLGEAPKSGAPINPSLHSVNSSYFEVRGQLRLDSTVVQERSLVFKQHGRVSTLWRERANRLSLPSNSADTRSTMPLPL